MEAGERNWRQRGWDVRNRCKWKEREKKLQREECRHSGKKKGEALCKITDPLQTIYSLVLLAFEIFHLFYRIFIHYALNESIPYLFTLIAVFLRTEVHLIATTATRKKI